MRSILIGLMLSTSITPAVGCILEQAMHNMEYGYVQINASYSKEMMPLLDQMEKMSVGSNNALPQGLQMSPQDSQRFKKLSFDVLVLRFKEMILSGYVRDVRVIGKMSQLAEYVRMGKEFKETDPDYLYYGLLLITSVAGKGSELKPLPSQDECSIDSGLWVLEKQEIDTADGAAAKAAWDRVLAAARLYKIDTNKQGWFNQLDKIPSFPAKQAAKRDLATVQDNIRGLEFIKSMEALRGLNQVSLMIYTTHNSDIRTSTDKDDLYKRFGSTWEAQVKVSDERIKKLESVIRILEQKVPSDSAIRNQQISDEMKKRGLQ